ncbi:MAG: ribosome-associated translation inhibitor RaiA [Ignavibacteria bacterium]|nr:ribosome-associated translation inhibitor RaiA [Ignavibacteria bacterium]
MHTKVTFRHLKAKPELQEAAIDAIKKMEKFSGQITSASVEFTSDSEQKVQFTLNVQGNTLVVCESSEDLMKALRVATDKMIRQLKKYKGKQIDKN